MSDTLITKQVIDTAIENGYTVANIPEGYNETAYPFRPVKCVENDIKNKITPVNNFLYFTTDTKKIYFGQNNKFLPMCSASGFFYGTKEIKYDNSGVKPDPNVTFTLSEIEGSEIPEVDDLILNIDGCFYRVRSIGEYEIQTERLTLQGTGGGGSDSPGGSANFSITVFNTQKIYSSMATYMPVDFKGYYNGLEENRISRVTLTIGDGSGDPFYASTEELPFNDTQIIDIFPYKHLFSSASTTVTIKVYDLYGNERSTEFRVQILSIELIATQKELISTTILDYTYACKLVGATTGISSKKIIYQFYTEDNLQDPIYEQTRELSATSIDTIQTTLFLSQLRGHGIYVLKVSAFATLTTGDKIYSNTLTHKLSYYDTEKKSPLLMILLPEVKEQYTNIPMYYYLTNPDDSSTYTLNISIDGELVKPLSITPNIQKSYDLYFENGGVYTLTCNVPELGLKYTETIAINKYTGNLPIIDTTRNDLMLYLNPKGKSNNEINRDQWTDHSGTYTATLSNLHYGAADGWLTDVDGTSYLQLISGASLSLSGFKPFMYDPTKYTNGDSRMGYGMTIEIDFEIKGTLDYDSELIRCISTNMNGIVQVGFAITGNRIRFYNSRLNGYGDKGPLMSVNLVEGKRIRLSFVIEPNTGLINFPMCYTYLNGILSNAVIYDETDDFRDDTFSPATLQINSSDGQIKIYGIRFYSSALDHKTILNNYTASLSTLTERQKNFDSNNVFNASGKVDYLMVSDADYNLEIPYMTITGGWQTVSKENKWTLKSQTAAAGSKNNPGLPTGKEDYRLIDIEVKYPKKNTYFKNYKDYSFKNVFDSGNNMSNAFDEKPNNGGCIMYAQGTSSMEYPVKNLRIRWKQDEDFFTVRPGISPVEIICMKADYMESSGSHNTGAANLVDALYAAAHISTPGQDHFTTKDNAIVTCIKGHPCLLFYRPDENTPYEYVGKYNLNLDKATPEPFGFNHDDSDFGYLDVGDEYYAIQYAKKDEGYQNPWIGQLNPSKGADYVPGQIEEKKTVGADEKVNSIHCFEFLDNTVEVCNFFPRTKNYIEDPETGEMIPDPTGGYHTYQETWYNTFTNKKGKLVPGWTLGFESRYPEDRIGYHDADMLYPLASWLNELYRLRYGYNENWELKNKPNEELALQRFKNEYQRFLDRDFLLTYYLVTEALLMVDNRVKNMMIATWGKEERSYIDQNGQKQAVKDYIFYPIFYDMDTMLGLDNTGVYRFNYYDEDTNPTTYNGNEVLWNFVRDALAADLVPYYNDLENAGLTADSILPYFNLNQANMANAAFYNGDADYKYLIPARNGYHDDLYDKDIAAGAAPYLYAAQGDRSLMREWIVTNRMKFLRGKYKSTNYQNGDRIEFRWYYPNGRETEFIGHENSITAVPPNGIFNLTSLQTGYAGVMLGANADTVRNVRFDGEKTEQINVTNAGNANGTEAYLLGLSNLTDLGDLSNKYMQKFIMGSSDIRLTNLTLGNPHKDYYNPFWATAIEGQSARITLDGCYYLRHFNLQNCSTFNNVLNFRDCGSIETILLTGSGVSALTLPANGLLKELRLPTSITKIAIDTHPFLTQENFSLGGYVYGSSNLIDGDEEGYYTNDYSLLTSVNVIDTPIDTYSIVRSAQTLQEYNLKNINWTITQDDTQYCSVPNDDTILDFENKQYYVYNQTTKNYDRYTETTYPAIGLLYEKYTLLDGNKIVCIPILNYLYTKSTINAVAPADALTGTITINLPEATVNEYDIYVQYAAMYPNVTILYDEAMDSNVTKAYSVEFYQNETITEGLTPYYSFLHNGEQTWGYLTSAEGPVGTALVNPEKAADNYYTYTFSGIWKDQFGNEYKTDSWSQDKPLIEYDDERIDVLKLTPVYQAEKRLFTITFRDDHDNIIINEGRLPFGVSIKQGMADIGKPILSFNYKEYTGSLEHGRWTLDRWITKSDFDNGVLNPYGYDLNRLVNDDLVLYAYYVEENAQETPTNLDCFSSTYTSGIQLKNNTSYKGQIIEIKNEYVNVLEGKITLPSFDNNNQPFIIIGGSFSNAKKITEVYFLNGCSYKITSNGSFLNCSALAAVYLPNNFEGLYDNTFQNCINLTTITLPDTLQYIGDNCFQSSVGSMKVNINKLPTSLNYIGQSAFWNGGDSITITSLPVGVETLRAFAFYNCKNVKIIEFGSIDPSVPGASQLTCLDAGCLQGAGSGISTITIYGSVSSIKSSGGSNAVFHNYGVGTLTNIYAARATDSYLLRNASTVDNPVYSSRADWIESRDANEDGIDDVTWTTDKNLGV